MIQPFWEDKTMPITPGSSSKLNTIKGVSAVLVTTAAEETALANKVLPANVLVKKSDGKVYLSDGVKTLANIDPLIDQLLNSVEKSALSNALGTGTYVRAANGVVVHDSTGKISDDSLNVVSSGKIVESYLSDYIDPTTHKILIEALPDTARAGVKYIATYSGLASLTAEEKKSLIFVIDATGDPSGDVVTGAAMYAWIEDPDNAGSYIWQKIAEQESLDIDVAAIRCDYTNVQAAGAVMYDHTVFLEAPTASQFVQLQEAAAQAESGSGT